MSSTGSNDAAASANIQHALARLQLQGFQAGCMHVRSRDIEVQVIQAHRGVREGLILMGFGDEVIPRTCSHGLNGCIPANHHTGLAYPWREGCKFTNWVLLRAHLLTLQ